MDQPVIASPEHHQSTNSCSRDQKPNTTQSQAKKVKARTHIAAPIPTHLTVPQPARGATALRFPLIPPEHLVQDASFSPRLLQHLPRNEVVREEIQRPRGVLCVCGGAARSEEEAAGVVAARRGWGEEGGEEGEHCVLSDGFLSLEMFGVVDGLGLRLFGGV